MSCDSYYISDIVLGMFMQEQKLCQQNLWLSSYYTITARVRPEKNNATLLMCQSYLYVLNPTNTSLGVVSALLASQ
jgi:hypothetical protein